MSPAGGYAVSLLTNGSGNVPKTAFFHHDHSVAALLKIEGKKVRKVSETEVGELAEGIAFSPDGKYLYVANLPRSRYDHAAPRGQQAGAGGFAQAARPSRLDARQHALNV